MASRVVLNEDVLIHIFYLNTYTSEIEGGFSRVQNRDISALDIARYTSQVCQSWRHLMLQSSVIWGNIIDLEVLNQASSEWVDEVMKRTGTVNLSIYGPVGHTSTSRFLFATLLDEHWHRVRRLDVSIKKARKIGRHIWDIFWKRPAPNLEKFIVTGFITDDVLPLTEPSDTDGGHFPSLFSGTAPLLRRMHSLPHFQFDHRATWVAQLRGLSLSGPLETVEALKIIAHSPRLESLDVQATIDSETERWTRQIRLPNLRRIAISSDIVGSLAYLDNITPRSDCSLILSIWESSDSLDDMDLLQCLLNSVSPYAKNFFENHCPTELIINVKNTDVRITAKKYIESEYFGDPKFSIILRSEEFNPIFDHPIIDAFLSPISSVAFKTISNVKFTLSHLSWSITAETSIQIFRSLNSIEKLTMSPWAMRSLNAVADSGSLFPGLSEVAIQYHGPDQHFNFENRLVKFLENRKEAGHPVRNLDLRKYAPTQGRPVSELVQGLDVMSF